MSETLLEVKGLKKNFGYFQAVKGIDLTVAAGDVLGFLGPNGAGKSTTMRMITGFIPATEGDAFICGKSITTDPIAAKRCLGYLPESAPSYRAMRVKDFLRFVAQIRGFSGAALEERVAATIKEAMLTAVENQTIETLSKGYRQRTCFAQAILHDPKILIMDEPTDGLDPNQKDVVRKWINNMAAKGKAIIISTHILEEVNAVCTRAIIIADGEKKDEGKIVREDGKPDSAVFQGTHGTGKIDEVFRKLTKKEER